MTFGKRITQLREEKGYTTRKKFAEILSLPETTLRNYETDAREPGHTFLKQMSDFFNVSTDYLLGLTEEREKVSSQQIKSSEMEYIEKYRFVKRFSPEGAATVDAVLNREYTIATQMKSKDLRIAELENSSSTIIEMPRHSSGNRHVVEYFRDASAGGGIFILGNEAAARISIPDSGWDERTDYVIQVNGRSMEPDYMDGDNVMVSQRIELRHGDVGIFVVNGKAFIKEYGKTELISRNNDDSPNIPIHEYDNIVCMGKVIKKLEGEYEIMND